MNHYCFIPESFVDLNPEVCVVSQVADYLKFVKLKCQTAAVDCTQRCTFQKAKDMLG